MSPDDLATLLLNLEIRRLLNRKLAKRGGKSAGSQVEESMVPSFATCNQSTQRHSAHL